MARSLRMSLALALLAVSGTALQIVPDQTAEVPPGCLPDSVALRATLVGHTFTCAEFCVPKSCDDPGLRWRVKYHGIEPSAEGPCADDRFTVPAGKLFAVKSPCGNATLRLFRRPRGAAEEPATPDTEEPATPDKEEPATPDTEEPATPDTEEPATPIPEEPAAPDTEEPATPDKEEPSTPDTEEPATPIPEEPATPDTEEPATPDQEEPATPDKEEPATPDTEKPATPIPEEPAMPDTEEPATPDKEEPATPDKEEPAAPDAEEPDSSVPKRGHRCGKGSHPFRGFSHPYGGKKTCTTYCVPEGRCLGLVQSGYVTSEFHIKEEGRCDERDFPVAVPVSTWTKYTIANTHGKACRGMAVYKFSQGAPQLKTPERSPSVPAGDPAEGRTCGPDHYPFKGVKRYPGSIQCTSYCVPDGACLGLVQDGTLVARLGITGEGICRKQDFPVSVPVPEWRLKMLESSAGAFCGGLTMHQFQTEPVKAEAVVGA